MANYEMLYAQFQLEADEGVELKALHELYERHRKKAEKLLVTTSVSDGSGLKVVRSEVSDAKLV